ncbi:hypothetical protein G7Z17_g3128 [Cylindrodendrum hubeiense]|uniref:Heterokaryon incompatibility domain-containing protein n=1 Tax=Cylindrodendrum hubeiense TaxID=595255 RepID=A0A9P5LB25_9HYPO|nr:hypothetical protein G7Z17_g3128 [Cylindrodendrum hubeiense]
MKNFFDPGPLCKKCSKIDFGQFDPNAVSQNQAGEQYSIELKHLLKERNTCRFCGLLFQALCLPENDPLRDNDLQKTIKEDDNFTTRNGRVDFKTWARVRERFWSTEGNGLLIKKDSRWPFGGYTKDSIRMTHAEADANSGAKRKIDCNAQITTNVEFRRGNDMEFNPQALGGASEMGLRAAEEFDNNREHKRWYKFVREIISAVAFFNHGEMKKVPAALWISVYGASHKNSGLMEVTVSGCSKRITRELKTLSRFRLRVASPEITTKDRGLRYGKILDKTKIDMELCRKWVDHCRNEHGDACNKPQWSETLQRPQRTGFRLIDVWKRAIVELNINATRNSYAALSYVWGHPRHSEGILHLNSTNKDALFKRNSLDDRSVGRTIADAMEITRKLGLRYLWADRLCILQHQQLDKDQQLEQMDRIYGSAVVTIVSASGRHLDEPIAGITTERSVNQLARQVTDNPDINVLVPVQRDTSLRPWSTRAWTLQEKLMSRRLLVFHDGTVDFCCSCGVSHEDMTAEDSCISNPPPLVRWLSLADPRLSSSTTRGMRLLRSPVFAEYAALIEQYTPRQMSKASDAVNAILGMLHILITNHQKSPSETSLLSGLPEQFLDQALHWQPAAGEAVSLRARESSETSDGSKVTFPSWSWAAWTAVEENAEGDYGGVRYESPFRAQTNDEGGLKKVVPDEQDEAEEFMRPLLKWYVVNKSSPSRNHPSLRPLNETGLGLAFDENVNIENWNRAVSAATGSLDSSMPSLNKNIANQLTDQHLIFRTKIAQFHLGETRTRTETTWKRNASGKLVVHSELKIRETPILNGGGVEVGRVYLPDPDRHRPELPPYDFALISEAQYFGDEKRVGFTDYPLFNIMLLRWDDRGRPFASRVAMGRITKEAWWEVETREEVVVLG